MMSKTEEAGPKPPTLDEGLHNVKNVMCLWSNKENWRQMRANREEEENHTRKDVKYRETPTKQDTKTQMEDYFLSVAGLSIQISAWGGTCTPP